MIVVSVNSQPDRGVKMKKLGVGFEGLEDRTLLAGNVTAALVGDTLFIVGNVTDNNIQLGHNGGTGEIQVDVYDNNETLTVIGGSTIDSNTGTFSGVNNIVVRGGAGDDFVRINRVDINGNLLVNGGIGDDEVFLAGGEGNSGIGGSAIIYGDSGDDFINVDNIDIGGIFKVFGGLGSDGIEVDGNYVGSSAGIYGGAGNDSICFENNYTEGIVLVAGGLGRDEAYFGGNLQGGSRALGEPSYLGSNWTGAGYIVNSIETQLEFCPFDTV